MLRIASNIFHTDLQGISTILAYRYFGQFHADPWVTPKINQIVYGFLLSRDNRKILEIVHDKYWF